MRKLVVALSAVAMVSLGASAAQAQAGGGNNCPTPEQFKFEVPQDVGDTMGGFTMNTGTEGSASFTIESGWFVDAICVKAGTTATVFEDFADLEEGNFRITTDCTITDIEGPGGDPDLELWAQSGDCTVTITRIQSGGPGFPGISHITFYGDLYNGAGAAVAPLVEAQSQGGSAAGGLAFTGAQISIMLVILAGLIAAGAFAWTAGRRRAAKAE